MSVHRRWYPRIFRAWLRVIPTRLAPEVEEQIAVLFEDQLSRFGGGPVGRLTLLASAMADALVHGRSSDFATATPPGPTQQRRSIGEWFASCWRDLRFAGRSLRRRPMFTGIAVLALGLGIGGTTAIFTVVDGVLLKRLPYENPNALVNVWKAWPSWQNEAGLEYVWDHIQFPWADYLNVRDNSTTLAKVAAHAQATVVFSGLDSAEELSVGEASANLFETLGVPMALGRPFLPAEVAPEGDPARVVILSSQFWNRRFGGDREVLGATIQLDGEPFEVVGVLPDRFRLGSDLIKTHDNGGAVDPGLRDVWMPLGYEGTDRGNSFELIARLAQGGTPERAQAEIQTLMNDGPDDQIARVELRKKVLTSEFRIPLGLLLGAAALLMLIACANVMGLLLGEAPGRRTEMSVRTALGAHRHRIVRQLVTENLVLGLAGAVLGMLFAWLGTGALLAVSPPLPRLEEVVLDLRVLAFAATAGCATGLIFGILPALDLSRSSVASRLRARGTDQHTRRLQSGVVTAQIALTMVLLVSAGLFARSFSRLMAVEPGFDTDLGLAVTVGAPPEGFEDAKAAVRHLDEILIATASVPGVSAVSAASRLPFAGGSGTQGFTYLHDGEPASSTQLPMFVHPTYFDVMGIPLLQGRKLEMGDDSAAPRAMVVSRSWAERNLGGESPLGIQVRYRGQEYDWTIVGVVDDVLHQSLGAETEATFYASMLQVPRRDFMLLLRSPAGVAPTASAVRSAIATVNPDIPTQSVGTINDLMRASESDDRFRTVLLSTFAILATVLAIVGIFGVTARAVSARSREIGIRTALGARVGSLKLLVLKDGLRSALAGVSLGLVGAAWATRLIGHQLYGIGRADPVAYIGATLVVLVVCVGAAYLPAGRVAKINPMEAVAEE